MTKSIIYPTITILHKIKSIRHLNISINHLFFFFLEHNFVDTNLKNNHEHLHRLTAPIGTECRPSRTQCRLELEGRKQPFHPTLLRH